MNIHRRGLRAAAIALSPAARSRAAIHLRQRALTRGARAASVRPDAPGDTHPRSARPEWRRTIDARPRQALGLVETRGWVAAVEAADAMTKSARVRLVRYEVTRDALVTILVRGELADVEAAVDAGSAAAATVGTMFRGHVIPAPDPSLEFMLERG